MRAGLVLSTGDSRAFASFCSHVGLSLNFHIQKYLLFYSKLLSFYFPLYYFIQYIVYKILPTVYYTCKYYILTI